MITSAGHLPGLKHREFDDFIRSLAGKTVRIKVSLYQKRRSLNQNAFYWGVVVESVTQLFRDNGNYVDPEDTHTQWYNFALLNNVKRPLLALLIVCLGTAIACGPR